MPGTSETRVTGPGRCPVCQFVHPRLYDGKCALCQIEAQKLEIHELRTKTDPLDPQDRALTLRPDQEPR